MSRRTTRIAPFIRFHWKRLSMYALLGGLLGGLLVGLLWNPYRDTAYVFVRAQGLTPTDVAQAMPHTTRRSVAAVGNLLRIDGYGVTPKLATFEAQQTLDLVLSKLRDVTAHDLPQPPVAMPAPYMIMPTPAVADDLNALRLRRVKLAVTLAQLRRLAQESDGMEKAAQTVTDSDSVRLALETLTKARQGVAAADSRYGPAHPRFLSAHAELSAAQQGLNRTVRLYTDALAAELASIDEGLGTPATAATVVEPRAGEPEARRASSSARNETPLSQNENVLQTPGQPTGPHLLKAALLLSGGLLLGLLAGVGAAINDDFRRGQVRNLGRLRREFDLPVLAGLPALRNESVPPLRALQTADNAILSEGVRSLFAALRLKTLRGERARTSLVASPMRGDGKSSLIVWLALAARTAGLRVVLVDADLRRPSLHKQFGVGNAKGLSDYLSGLTGIDRVIYDRDESGVHLVPGQAVPHNAIGLVSGERMGLLITELRERYDMVLVDTPSCMGISDAALIAPLCDQVLMLARAEHTEFAHLSASLLPFQFKNGPALNLVVTQMRMHQLSENAGLIGAAAYSEAASA